MGYYSSSRQIGIRFMRTSRLSPHLKIPPQKTGDSGAVEKAPKGRQIPAQGVVKRSPGSKPSAIKSPERAKQNRRDFRPKQKRFFRSMRRCPVLWEKAKRKIVWADAKIWERLGGGNFCIWGPGRFFSVVRYAHSPTHYSGEMIFCPLELCFLSV